MYFGGSRDADPSYDALLFKLARDCWGFADSKASPDRLRRILPNIYSTHEDNYVLARQQTSRLHLHMWLKKRAVAVQPDEYIAGLIKKRKAARDSCSFPLLFVVRDSGTQSSAWGRTPKLWSDDGS